MFGIQRTISSTFVALKNNQKLDIRAQQRTYDGAYTRASIATLAFALLVTKLFSKDFLPIGTVYTIYGSIIFMIAVHRTHQMKDYFQDTDKMLYYKTSGATVMFFGTVSIICYTVLLILILRLDDDPVVKFEYEVTVNSGTTVW